MSVHPIRDYIAVSKESRPEKTSGGIFIAHTEEKNVAGKVVAVGSGRVSMNGTTVPLEVVVGDNVVFNKNLATEVKDTDGTVVLVLREDQIVCVLR